MDSDDDKQHFDYKEIVKKETKKSKKLRKKLEKAKSEMEENFKVDLDDERFSAVFQSADYNVDPSHPNFKTTKIKMMLTKAMIITTMTTMMVVSIMGSN